MGGCCTTDDVQRANREIEVQILQQKKIDKEIKKLLLLGSGSSGKSTLFRQIQCIHGFGLEDTDYKDSTRSIRENIVQSMIKLLKESEKHYTLDPKNNEKYGIDTTDAKVKQAIEKVAKFSMENFDFTSG
ncbi:guanine nucleotide-binding protein subunit alpha-14 [Reticulomyxa filosa]|uniref:Guanine nucleotide-binding protein subunit alpha-14 n=1 Tax=Reticulomyxa filosa TaxID=46433 RepID=X6N0X1_RETFI|nr:guanine nucleotide-binding protein subunit alpha-14 [Reticulomyxa filosa]|eukprot:ETO19900.1 guanine nucleotide-binding protein subunit alpha-14 [Reticulomyxa filosa]